MTDKNMYRQKVIKRNPKRGNSEACDLAKEIEELKNKLNRAVSRENKILTSAEVLELSQKLDELIAKYMKIHI